MSKICYRCNSEIDDNTIFCPECGAIQNAANVNASNNTPVTPMPVAPTSAAPTQNISEVTAQVNQQMTGMGQVPPMQPEMMNQMPPQGMMNGMQPGMGQMPPMQQGMMNQMPPQNLAKIRQENRGPKEASASTKKSGSNGNNGNGSEKKKGNGLLIGIVALFSILLVTAAVLSFYYVGVYQKNIRTVKKDTIEGYPNDSYESAFEGYFDDGTWKYFKDSSGEKIVEFTGKKKVDGERSTTVIRFTVDGKDVEGTYLEVNGEAKTKLEYEMLMNNIFATANGSDYVDFSELDEDDIDNAVTEATTETTIETTEATTTEDKAKCPYEYEQKVVVTVEGAASSYATLELMEWDNGDWVSRFSCNAMVGKSGVGGDYGEGKNITPIGTFKLGPVLTTTKAPNNLDYYTVTADTCVVDDVNSDLYNIITDTSSVPAGVSCDGIGNNIVNGNLSGAIFIQHNGDGRSSKGVVPGKGSVITICGCRGQVNATAGCIDISSSDYSKLLELLNGDKTPVIEIKVK